MNIEYEETDHNYNNIIENKDLLYWIEGCMEKGGIEDRQRRLLVVVSLLLHDGIIAGTNEIEEVATLIGADGHSHRLVETPHTNQ